MQKRKENLIPRVEGLLRILVEEGIAPFRYLDLGCKDGELTERIEKITGAQEVIGIDRDEKALKSARNRGITVHNLDVSKERIPLADESVDLVTANELIEHLYNPDHMLREVFRVLKEDGYFLLSTPNLGSWVNRLIFLLGYQPYNVEVSKEILAGVPRREHTYKRPQGHIKPFTLKALTEILAYHKFKVLKVGGEPGVHPKSLQFVDILFSKVTSLARRLIVLATKY